MPIAARWRSIESLPPPRGRDRMPGVYELADEDRNVIYIGQSGVDVPNRLRQHLGRPGCVSESARYWRYEYSRVPKADEARLLDEHRRRTGGLPRCNRANALMRTPGQRYAERSGEE